MNTDEQMRDQARQYMAILERDHPVSELLEHEGSFRGWPDSEIIIRHVKNAERLLETTRKYRAHLESKRADSP